MAKPWDAHSGLSQFKEFNRVSCPYHSLFVLGHVGVDLVNERLTSGPFTFDMREIRGKHNFSDANMMAQFYRHAFILDAEIDVVPDVIARAVIQRRKPQIILRPADVALIPEVTTLQPERHPSQTRLGEEDF